MDFLLSLAVLVTLIWLPLVLGRFPLAIGGVAFLVVAGVWGVEFMSLDVGPIHMSLDRFLLVGLVLAYLVQRALGRTQRKPLAWDDLLLCGFVGCVVLSTFTHNWRDVLPGDAPIVQHLINGYLSPLVLYWIARQSKLTDRQLTAVYAGFVLYGVYLTLIGLLEAAGQYALVFPRHVADPTVGIHFGRARGPMVSSVTYGLTLAACVIAGWGLWSRVGRGTQLCLLMVLPAALAAIFYSLTRSVWLGMALALGILMVLGLRGTWRFVLPGTLACAGLVVGLANFDRILAFDRTDNSAAQTSESVESRGSFAYVSWKMFQDRPLWGAGFGQFPRAKLPYLSDRAVDLRLEAIRPMVHHNTYLSLLTEVGAIGLGLFVATLALWFRGGWRQLRDGDTSSLARTHGLLFVAVLAFYAVQCLFHEMSYSARDNGLVFYFAGLTAALRPAASPRGIGRLATTGRSLWSVIAGNGASGRPAPG